MENPFFGGGNANRSEAGAMASRGETIKKAGAESWDGVEKDHLQSVEGEKNVSRSNQEIHWHNLLVDLVQDVTIASVLEIPPGKLDGLYSTAKFYSKPENLKELKDSLDDKEKEKAEAWIYKILSFFDKLAQKRGAA